MQFTGFGKMREKPDKPLQTLRTINGTRFIGRHCRTATFREFQRSSEAALEELRLLANQMAMCIGVPDKTDRRHSVGQALKISVYFFRVASGRFFRQLPWSGSLLRLLLRNRNNVGMGIYVADRLLNDISKAFEVRERQLRGETAAPVAEPRRLAPLPEPKTGTGCDIVSLFETRRFFSAPWSASRRLKAARLRGDTDEARRMEALLGEFLHLYLIAYTLSLIL